ncbi:MAG TPA: epoxide hydrolase [Puia sp.]|nr:epoxide hydrolase [Puia sp.]
MNTQTMPAPHSTAEAADIEPFNIAISPYIIEDLRERLGRARWPDEIEDSGWQYGANLEYLRHLCTHWAHGFDWKEQEDQLNALHHYRTTVDGFGLHFIHERGADSASAASAASIPILLLHGWPDSFARFLKVIPLLTAKSPDGLSFDVVVPSIPGFGFSDKPMKAGMGIPRIAELFAGLMKKLGYQRYLVHGGDWGSSIAEAMAMRFPDRIRGLHLTDVPYGNRNRSEVPDMTEAEKDYFRRGQQWLMQDGAYGLLQSTKPQTLAYAVNDSPIGLAAWIIDKFYAWTDHPGNLEQVYTRDELLVNLTIYWITQTSGSSFRLYYETMHSPQKLPQERIDIPTAICIAPKDMVNAPREYAERLFTIRQWTELPVGGHFLAMERPALLAADIFVFAGKLNH